MTTEEKNEKNLVRRINRRLATEGKRLRANGIVVDITDQRTPRSAKIVWTHVNPPDLARELGIEVQ